MFYAIVKIIWKAQRFLNEISSNWGNVISSIQSLPTPSLQSCVLPLLLEPVCHIPAYRRVVCRYQLASCSPWRHQVGFFCNSRLTKALARAPSGAAPVKGTASSCPHGSCCCCLSACSMESSKVWGQERLWNHKLLKLLKTKIISSHVPQWRDLSRSFLLQWGG